MERKVEGNHTVANNDEGVQAERFPLKPLVIAVLIPCHNEAVAIANVVKGFQDALPGCVVYVYDNNSTDNTSVIASSAGAVVRHERLQGKGNVVRRMFGDIEADVYLLVDGDDTYDPRSASELVRLLLDEHLDMVAGARVTGVKSAYRRGHRLGNFVLTNMVGLIFSQRFTDMLTGYRVFSRRFVKSFPALATGFEIETELTVHALEMRMNVLEVPTLYRERQEGSVSKLRTFSDGFRILRTIAYLVKEERPLQFFGALSGVLVLFSLALGVPVIIEFMETGKVLRFPTAILASGVMILGFLCLFTGLILDSVTHGRRELKRLAYLSIPARTGS
jgi:glycosyltransferase involved in cell wall biosynthesis